MHDILDTKERRKEGKEKERKARRGEVRKRNAASSSAFPQDEISMCFAKHISEPNNRRSD